MRTRRWSRSTRRVAAGRTWPRPSARARRRSAAVTPCVEIKIRGAFVLFSSRRPVDFHTGHAQKYFKKLRRAAKKRRAAPAAPAPAPVVVTDSDSSLDVSSTSRSPRAAAPPQADYAAVPTPPVQPRAGSFDDSLSPTSALLREPIVDDRENAALTVDDAPHLTGPVSSWASLSNMLDPGFAA